MALFLSKVFGRKRHEDKASTSSKSSASPLEGKFEYVIPSPSPEKGPDYPHLSLNLPERRENRVLSNVFENADAAARPRLSPEQALVIVRACSQVIIARGLETLGIMHPHWHSASPATQQRLVLHFIQSSPAVFESEVNSTRSAHDVAAVFRWALRHLELPGPSFGNDPAWYHNYFEAEKSASYPPKSFSEILAPQLPNINLELLITTLNLFSSLAAHSEANSISGSKLSKFLGLWLLTVERSTPGDDFLALYNKWDKHGRILEHLFLSHIRNEIANHRMPKRLVELVKRYPYSGNAQSSTEHDLLPRPRFSTRRFDALFVHIDTESPLSALKASKLSLQMIADALNAITPSTDAPPYSIWRRVQQISTAGDEDILYSPSVGKFPGVGRVLSEETLGILSLLAEDEFQRETSINFVSRANASKEDDRSGAGKRSTSTSSHVRQLLISSDTATIQQPSSNSLGLNLDWNSFSSSGFSQSSPLLTPLAETLLESKDSEVTSPSVTPSRKGSKKSAKAPPHQSRRSLDVLPPITIPATFGIGTQLQNDPTTTSGVPANTSSRVIKVELIPLDEAFIDFWNDSLLDPITDIEAWPKFVVCRLKTSVVLDIESRQGKKVEWMVVEQQFVKTTPKLPSAAQSPTSQSADTIGTTEGPATTVESSSSPRSPAKRASSPRPSLSSVNASVKRFSFWGGSKKDKSDKQDSSPTARKKKTKEVRVGEMGEILADEVPKSPKAASPSKKVVEVPAVVQEEQSIQEEKKGVPATQAKEEVNGEHATISDVAVMSAGVVVAGVTAVVAEIAANIQGGDVEESRKNVMPAVTEISDELNEQEEKGGEISAPTPVDPHTAEKYPTVVESSSAIHTDSRIALDKSAPPEQVLAQADAPSVIGTSAIAEMSNLDADIPATEELTFDEAVTQEIMPEEVNENPSHLQEFEFVDNQPVGEEVEDVVLEESVAVENLAEPTAIQELVVDVPAGDEHIPSPEEPAPAPEEPIANSEFAQTEPTAVPEPVVEMFEPTTTDKPVSVLEEPAQSVTEPIVQEPEEEEIAESGMVNEPEALEPVPNSSATQEPEVAPPEDASESVLSDDTVPASHVEPVLIQEHLEDPQVNRRLAAEVVASVVEVSQDVPAPLASEDHQTASSDDVVVEPDHTEVSEVLPVVGKTPVESHRDEHKDSQLPLGAAEPQSESQPTPFSPVQTISVEMAETSTGFAGAPAVPAEAPETVPALEVSAIPPDEVSVQEPEPEVSESTKDVAIKSNDETDNPAEPVADDSGEPEPELAPSSPVESTVNLISNSVEDGEDALEEIIHDTETELTERFVHSELLRESTMGTENDTVSIDAVPVVDAPVIPPATPSSHSATVDTPSEEEENDLEAITNDLADDLPDTQLPPAPETVVVSGETVGPTLALNSSETVTTALADNTHDVEEKGQMVEDSAEVDDADMAVEDVEVDPQLSEPRYAEVENENEAKPATPLEREPEDTTPSI
ncbi:hypothetical protein J3R30DRAFT_2160573 [Lentinula aciculospora]|uniref:Rho-GAP domain-containing protein n=1 Tax=Lentinula aciculospora TaxID=153920 RepID=A0A9W9DSJ8_9AGAR|nr:hypothetical protein J3R30DRAFT_2160573 [Lentinula aciculospora]